MYTLLILQRIQANDQTLGSKILLEITLTKFNKTKDWALVQNAASAGVKVRLGLFR